MQKGKQKILEDVDIPLLQQADHARTWYLLITIYRAIEQKQGGSSDNPSILSIIFLLPKEINFDLWVTRTN